MLTVIGLMSGTSMDGIDVAVLRTDGEALGGFGPTHFRPYAPEERDILRAALRHARELEDRTARPGALAEAEMLIGNAHEEAVRGLLEAHPEVKPDLIGFHGQTVLHAPEKRLTIQIGDGAALAERLGVPVVHDFRAADVAAGGQGAPFVPVYHRALVRGSTLQGNIVVVNIGGVANITRIGRDGAMVAGDTGPGNALIDDFVRARTGEPFDRDGALAARGQVEERIVSDLMRDFWFTMPFPKSLDRNDFAAPAVAMLPTEDAAATLAAFTAESISAGIRIAGGADEIVVTGGGVHNRFLLQTIADTSGIRVWTADELGWNPDFIEAQAFGYLAARSVKGLPLSFPETTGVPEPMTGGVMARPSSHKAEAPA